MNRYHYTSVGEHLQNHPLIPAGSKAHSFPTHRLVLWKKIGPGTHACHWCQKPVTWMPGHHTERGALTVDHVDNNSRNNSPDNLVPSCHGCNAQRNHPNAPKPGDRWAKNGRQRARGIEKTCEKCGTVFLIAPSMLRHKDPAKRPGRYCSRVCMYARNT